MCNFAQENDFNDNNFGDLFFFLSMGLWIVSELSRRVASVSVYILYAERTEKTLVATDS